MTIDNDYRGISDKFEVSLEEALAAYDKQELPAASLLS